MNKNLIRHKIAYEAAILIAQMGINDIQYAKNKAAKKFGVSDLHLLPANEEILQELKNYQALFSNDQEQEHSHDWQQQVLKIMRELNQFNPRLVDNGDQLDLFPNSSIDIYISADSLEEICIFLLDRNIPYNLKEKKIYVGKNRSQIVPYFDLFKEKYKIQLIFLTQEKHPLRPLNPVDNKPIQYMNIQQTEAQFNVAKE